MKNPLFNLKNKLQSAKTEDIRQKAYLQQLETVCKVNKPIFINRNVVKWQEVEKQTNTKIWAINDENLVTASNVTESNIVGRYRIDNNNSDGIFEGWFELDANRDIHDEATMKNEWKFLSKCAKKLLAALQSFGIEREYVLIKSSGRGLHFSVFTSGFRDVAQYTHALQAIMQASGLPMAIKQSDAKGITFGFDSVAVTSSKRKVRELGGQNDKLQGVVHYVSLVDNLDEKTYPFVKKAVDVIYPQSIPIFQITKDFVNRLHEFDALTTTKDNTQAEGTVVYDRAGELGKLYECPLIAKLWKDAETNHHLTNEQRVFASQIYVFFGDAGEKALHQLIGYCSDYSESYTQKQIENVKRNRRKPITCDWARKNNLCPECNGLSFKSPVNLAWKAPKLEVLREEIREHVKLREQDKQVIDFMLATGLERLFNPEGDAIWAYLIAVSGSGKTELMRLMNDWKYTYTIDEFTKASFVSGYKADEESHSNLDEYNNKVVYVKDMSQMLTTNKDARNEIFGALRNIYDGYMEKMFGTKKGKVSIPSKFGLFIGMTPVIDAYYTLSNQLGERFVKIRFACEEKNVLESVYTSNGAAYILERKRLQRRVNEFLETIKVKDYESPPEFKDLVLRLMDWTATMRTALFVESEGGSPSFRGSRELPSRLLNQAKKMWQVLACVRGKDMVTMDEISFVGTCMIQTPPIYRTQAYCYLLKHDDISVNELAKAMHVDNRRANMIMQELYFMQIVESSETTYSTYTLTDKFKAYGKEFQALGWFNWLDDAWKEFLKFKEKLPKKRIEQDLDSNWIKEPTLDLD